MADEDDDTNVGEDDIERDGPDVSWITIRPDFVKSSLLGYNYLPRQSRRATELPPSIGSSSFSSAACDDVAALQQRRGKDFPGYAGVDLRLTRFDITLRNAQVPHPHAYAKLVSVIADNWGELSTLIASERSGLPPRQHNDGRLFVMSAYDEPDSLERELRGGERFGHEFEVKADIKNFFPSIYTHSIAWAMAGKPAAKRTRSDMTLLYNVLDREVRLCRRGETNGVAIGPGTSNVVSEILLAAVDRALADEGFDSYQRYIDDYTYFASDYSDAQQFVERLQSHLYEFELQLNPSKTEIHRLPAAKKPSWITELVLHQPPRDASSAQVNAFIDHALEVSARFANGSVLRYALTLLLERKDLREILPKVAPRILNLVFHRPALIPQLATLLDLIAGDVHGLETALQTITMLALRGMKSDVASWAIHLLAKWDGGVPDECVSLAQDQREVLPLVEMLGAGWLSNADAAGYLSAVDRAGDAYDTDSQWLLAYELFLRGGSVPAPDPSFEVLATHGVRFYERP